jgi:hypothetical protein
MTPPADPTPTRFRDSRPGRRFQDRYWRHRATRNERPLAVRIALLVLGVVLALLGLLMLVLPGPGLVFLALGGALFASESLRIARALDWLEVRGRRTWRWLRGRFRRGAPQRIVS